METWQLCVPPRVFCDALLPQAPPAAANVPAPILVPMELADAPRRLPPLHARHLYTCGRRLASQSSSWGRVLPVFACICPPSKWCEQLRLRLNYWMPGDSCTCQLRYREGIQFEPTGSGARASRYVIWDTRACMGACGIKCTSSFCSLYGISWMST